MTSRMSKKTWLIMITLIIAILALVGIAPSCSFFSPSDSMPASNETPALDETPASNETPAPNETSASNETPALNGAPDFTLPTLTGANITLFELKGTPVVLNFWSISCPYCREQLPYLEDVAQQSEVEIKVMAVNIVDTVASLQKFFGDYEPTMIIALDSNGETFVNYCQNYTNTRGAIPFTLFIDREGIVQYVKIGAFASETELRNTIDSVFEPILT